MESIDEFDEEEINILSFNVMKVQFLR